MNNADMDSLAELDSDDEVFTGEFAGVFEDPAETAFEIAFAGAFEEAFKEAINLNSIPASSDDGTTNSKVLINLPGLGEEDCSASDDLIFELPINASRQLQINISLFNYISGLRHLSKTEYPTISNLWMAEIAKIAPVKDAVLGIECFVEASFEYLLTEWRHADRTLEAFRAVPFEKEFTDTIGPGMKYKVRAVAMDSLHVDGLQVGKEAFEFLVEWKLKPTGKKEEPTWDDVVVELQRAKRKWIDENGLILPPPMSPLSVAADSDLEMEDEMAIMGDDDRYPTEEWHDVVFRDDNSYPNKESHDVVFRADNSYPTKERHDVVFRADTSSPTIERRDVVFRDHDSYPTEERRNVVFRDNNSYPTEEWCDELFR